MARFAVQYASATGKRTTDTVEADSERAAMAEIERSGGTPISVRAVKGKSGGRHRSGARRLRGGKAMRRALLDFTHQLSAISESGIPMIAGLRAVGDQTEHQLLSAAIKRIIHRVEGGRGLAEAMDAEDEVFPDVYVKTVAAGEAAGNIPEVLESLARYMEADAETRNQVKSAMLYPMLVVIALVGATGFMLVFVVPQFATMFEKFGGELPIPTRILMAISSAITNHYLWVGAGLAATLYGLRILLRFKNVRSWVDARALRLPVLGNLLLAVYMTRFIELLGLLTKSALPITQSLRITAESMTNAPLQQDVRGMIHAIEGGRTLGEAFAETKWITPLVKRMLAIGEHAGRSDEILGYVGKYYTRQTQQSVKLLSTLIEPVLVTCLAGVVLFFALAIFLPMWKILKLAGGG